MKNVAKLSVIGALALGLSTPAFAHWFDTPHFKAKHGEWSAKLSTAHAKLMAAREAHKAAHAAVKAEKDKKKQAELRKAVDNKALWGAELAWLELHMEWKPYEVKKANEEWDAQVKKIEEGIASYKKPEVLVGPRNDLWKAQRAWLDANRAWKKAESEYHLKHWQERITKLKAKLAK